MSLVQVQRGAVIVVGSLHHDIMIDAPHRPATGETVTGSRWYPKFGGKGGNQAVAASRSGCETRMVGAIGKDAFAPMVLDQLEKSGIATDRIAQVAKAGTGMSVAIVDAEGDYGAVIVSGANLSIDPSQFHEDGLWQDAAILILQNEIPEDVNLAAAKAAKARNIPVCLNAAPSRPLCDDLINAIDVIVVNAIEAQDLCGKRVDSLDSAVEAAIILSRDFRLAIVTAGGHGSALASGRGVIEKQSVIAVEVISTHGAGDVFVGTFCAAIASGKDEATALSMANRYAAYHVSGLAPPSRG